MAFILTLAFVNGCATVISKMINYRCTKYLGTNNGSLVNYVVASVLSFILLAVSSKFSINLYSFSQAPWWSYLGGAFGILLGYAAVTAGMALMGVAPVIDGSTIAFLMLFSMATGVLFGVYPALKASRLRPVDALRME